MPSAKAHKAAMQYSHRHIFAGCAAIPPEAGKRVRMLSVCASGLVPENDVDTQLTLLPKENDAERDKLKEVDKTVDKIRQKYGAKAIIKGAVVDTDIGIYDSPRKKVPR